MNNLNLSKLSAILSVLSIIIAGFSAFSLEMNFENASFVLGTLTLLVTLLIGWQIYNKIELEDRVRKKIDKCVQTGTNTALFVALAQLGRSSFNKGDIVDAIQSLLNALCVWEDNMESPLAKEAYDYCNGREVGIDGDEAGSRTPVFRMKHSLERVHQVGTNIPATIIERDRETCCGFAENVKRWHEREKWPSA